MMRMSNAHLCTNTHMHDISPPIHTHTPHSGNLLCSWWNVDQMAYIPLLSQTREATLPPPAAYTLSKGPRTHTPRNMDVLKGQHFYSLSASCASRKKQQTHAFNSLNLTQTCEDYRPERNYYSSSSEFFDFWLIVNKNDLLWPAGRIMYPIWPGNALDFLKDWKEAVGRVNGVWAILVLPKQSRSR